MDPTDDENFVEDQSLILLDEDWFVCDWDHECVAMDLGEE